MISKLKVQKTIYVINLISFYFFTYGKIFTILYVIIKLIRDFLKDDMDKNLFKSYRYFFFILLVFSYAFFSAVIHGNDIWHIIRNNFFTLIFIVMGIQIAHIYKDNFFNETIKIVGILALIQMSIYIASLVSLPFHIFVDEVITKKLGYSLIFAGLGENNTGFGLKMVTNLTSIYIFLIPYGLFVNNQKIKKYWIIIMMTVIVSASITQYAIIFMYIVVYYLKLAVRPLNFLKSIFSLRIIISLTLIIYFLFQSGINLVLEDKIDHIINPSTSSKLTSASLRVVQAKILFEEFSEEPIFGKGLGYDSKKYHSIRNAINGTKKIKDYNYSMYENQYLDILMKFGLVGAIIIYFLFFFYPVFFLLKKYISCRNEMYFATLIGYFGLTIFAGSNGNAFYAYTTMFVWGIVIYFIISPEILTKSKKICISQRHILRRQEKELKNI